jgi:hypothetical protein
LYIEVSIEDNIHDPSCAALEVLIKNSFVLHQNQVSGGSTAQNALVGTQYGLHGDLWPIISVKAKRKDQGISNPAVVTSRGSKVGMTREEQGLLE